MTVNGEDVLHEVEPRVLLVHFLRDALGLTGTHWGCDTSNCGTCVVLVDGEPVKSCTVLAAMAAGHDVRTVEGLADGAQLDPVQLGFINEHGLQCGFCTPGMMLTARALLDRNPNPTPTEIRRGDLRPDLPLHRLRDHRAIGALGGRTRGGRASDGRRARGGQPRATADAGQAELADFSGESPVTALDGRPKNPAADSPDRPIGYGRMQRKEDPRFVRGHGTFIDDIVLPGMLHGAILRSPMAHARIVAHRRHRRALAQPNVHGGHHRRATSRPATWPGCRRCPRDVQAVLATDKVRFQGQEVAFVVADDRYAARDALELIDVEYEPLPPWSTRAARSTRTRRSSATTCPGAPTTTSSTGRPATRPRPTRCSPRPTSSSTQEMVYPRVAPGAAGDLRRGRRLRPGQRQADGLGDQPGPARPPDCSTRALTGLPEHKIRVDLARHRRRLRQQGARSTRATCCAIVASIDDRPSGEVDGGPLREPDVDRVRPRLHDARRDRRDQGRARSWPCGSRCSPTTARSTRTAQPTKFPAGFFHIFTGSYDLQAAHCTVTGVYTNKAPGGVAYACSFRITEAVYLVERMVDMLAARARHRPGRAAAAQPDPRPTSSRTRPRPAGSTTRATTSGRCGWRWTIAGYDELRREQADEARARRADGHRHVVLHRGGRRGPAQAHGHPRPRHGRRRRAADAPDRQGACSRISVQTQGQGHETTFAQIVAEELGHPARGRRGRARRHRPDAVRPRHLRVALDAGVAAPRSSLVGPQGPRAGPAGRRGDARGRPRRPGVGEAAAGLRHAATPSRARRSRRSRWPSHGTLELPEGVEGHLDAEVAYNPPNLTFPFGAYICVVDVDPGTGEVKVRRFIAVDDCGIRINPMIVEGQVHGGLDRRRRDGADGGHRASTTTATASAARSWTT